MASADSGVIDVNGFVVFLQTLENKIPKGGICQEIDPEIWFSNRAEDKTNAKRICQGCPVRKECFERGKEERWGIWGGVDMATYGLEEMICERSGLVGFYSRQDTGTPKCYCPECLGGNNEFDS